LQASLHAETLFSHAWRPCWYTALRPPVPDILTRAQVGFVRGLGRRLREFGQALGLDGGVLVHQVGPDRVDPPWPSFRHELGVLGAVPFPGGAAREWFEQATGLDGSGPRLLAPLRAADGVPGRSVFVTCRLLPATTHHLRLVLAGSSVRYPVKK